jgi:two-component system response regulator FixJ
MIMISAQGEVRTAVQAMRGGAVDFLEKPFRAGATAGARRDLHGGRRGAPGHRHRAAPRPGALRQADTAPARPVLNGLTEGKPSKVIASELGLSPRTVDVHRFRIMHQLQADSLPDLFRMIVLLRGDVEEVGKK